MTPSVRYPNQTLVTPAQYARDNGLTRQTVYKYLLDRTLKEVVIAGRKFVQLT